ncbi:DNA-packaging protein [Dyadobacter sp. CY347]|uniref:DNA-packaging protein n=1 Tax=Dyadobacter sp. CY347 TaxID=2909336 RepID=UPI001F29216D|nr:DNA-packaging protein [Dyadobacter sp. CY347]MCF2487452.1 DNA-packaging protein [Dyadobacter sp. CY347]
MSAPNGNSFWTLRSEHGRDTLFESPEMMWEAACEYFEWCEENPLIEVDFRGKDADQVHIPKMRPFTMQGLCRYLDCNTQYFRQFEDRLKDDQQGFSRIITRIKETIYEQKFTGAASGFLNPNIIARDLGLIDKKDMSINADVTVEYTDGPNETED